MGGTVKVRLRPIRLAHLVDPSDARQVREAIQLSSTLWAGSFFPIVPLYKRMPRNWREGPISVPSARSVVRGYIEAFDPDVLVQFSETVPQHVRELGLQLIRADELWKNEGRDVSAPSFGIGIYELLNDIFESDFKYKKKYPTKIVIPKIPGELSLFWSSLFGEIPHHLLERLLREYTEPLEIKLVDIHSDELGAHLAPDVMFPRRMTQWATDVSARSSIRSSGNVFFLDASSTQDVIDFWNLRAAGKQVLPVPKQLAANSSLRDMVVDFLKQYRRPWPQNPEIYDHATLIRARNCSMAEVQEYAQTLSLGPATGDTARHPFLSIQHWYPRIWDEWARDKDGVAPADVYGKEESTIELHDTEGLRLTFEPLTPAFCAKYSQHDDPRYANEISFRVYGGQEYLAGALPKASGQNYLRAISGFGSFRNEWRVGRNGLVKLVRGSYSEICHIPTAENAMFGWLADQGWQAQLSPGGILAKQILRILDGHPLPLLLNEKVLNLLEYMNGGAVRLPRNSSCEEPTGAERHLTVAEVKNRLRLASGKFELYEYLLAKNILKLGARAKCPKCLRRSWFSIDELRTRLICPKCQDEFPAIGALENGQWCYKTSGPFSVDGYADGAYAVLRSLEFFRDHRTTVEGASPVLSFTARSPDKKDLEVDFALFWYDSYFGERHDGVAFGECKTYGAFEQRDFDRMRSLGKMFPGAILIFSTFKKSLSSAEIAEIKRIAQAGRKQWKIERPINPVLILTGNELFTHTYPPYCWDDATTKRFQRLWGLLRLCDATQQIYLGLPSWHADWHEQFERRRKRHNATLIARGVSLLPRTGGPN
jgi:hypothetical protein